MAPSLCDLIIIGSGFGGAVCARRAAQAGLRVVILERGRRITPGVYQDLAAGASPLFLGRGEPGLLELHRLRGLLALTASAVGGGSNIYTAVTIRPPAEVFDHHWPAGLDYQALAPYYDRVEEIIAPSRTPEALPRVRALEDIGRRMGVGVTRLPLSMDWPEDTTALGAQPETAGVHQEVANWLRGGHAARKRTLDQTYLAQAESDGALVRPLHEALALTPHGSGYCVEYRQWQDGRWRSGTLTAPRVVIAAGALNTNRLLLHCRDRLGTLPDLSNALGRRFFTNGDFGGLLVGPTIDLSPDAGPPVTAWLDLWQRDRMYIMETGLVPFDFGGFAGLLNPARWLRRLRLARAKRCTWSFGVMGYCDDPGQLVLGRRGALVHRHEPAKGAAFQARTMAALHELAGVAGGRLIVPPAVFVKRLPITIHPLGGATLADSPESGVTDPTGEVFGYPGLYVADGSLLPAPTGVPPSMTIAAVAERVAENLIKQC